MEELYDLLPDFKDKNIDDYLDYCDIDLLEYVCEVADWLLPNHEHPEHPVSTAPAIFANRYFESKISDDEVRFERHKMFYCYQGTFEDYQQSNRYRLRLDNSYKDKYLQNKDLQETIKAFELDVSKLWYLLLFVHDYIEDIGTNAPKLGKTVKEDILDLTAKLSEATEITLKKSNRKSYSTDCERTIDFVRTVLQFCVDNEEKLPQLFSDSNTFASFEFDDYFLEKSHQKWKFADIFLYFLKDRKAKNLPNEGYVMVSRDKMLFISRLIYTVGYADEEYNRYDNEKGKPNRMLSNLLRKYRNEKFPDVMGHYYI